MLYSTLTVSVFAFATVAIAAPHIHSRRENVEARGVTWTRDNNRDNNRDDNNNNNNDNNNNNNNNIQDLLNFNSFGDISNNDFVSFQQTTVVIITEERGRQLQSNDRQREQEFSVLIQQQLFGLQLQNWMSDNIRRNHYNSRNNNVNTVIVIVQQVNDNRNGDNRKRYYTRQIESNRNRDDQVVVVIQEQNILQINGNIDFSGRGSSCDSGNSGNSGNSDIQIQSNNQSSPSNDSSQAQPERRQQSDGIYEPNSANFGGFTPNIYLIPEGIDQPQFGFGSKSDDPALIVQQSENIFVQFQEQDRRSRDDAILTVAAVSSESIAITNII